MSTTPDLTILIDHALSGYQADILKSKITKVGLSPEAIPVTLLSDYSVPSNTNAPNRVILGLGDKPLFQLTGKKSIHKWHLSPIQLESGALFMGSFSLQQIQAQYELGVYLDMAFMKVKKYLNEPYRKPEENFHLNPSLEETYAILQKIKEEPEIACDIETGYGQINTVGFAWSVRDAIAINTLPERCGPTAYYELWNAIRSVLEGGSRKIFQNFMYDTSYFSAYGIETKGEIYDTMHAMKVLWPEFKSDLGNVGRIYTDRPYWKDDGKVEHEEGSKKDWGNIRDWRRHYLYNCLSKDMRVVTEHGLIPISQLARKKQKLQVRSWNEKRQCAEWKPITNWLIRKESKPVLWRRILLAGMQGRGGLCVTPDHKILTGRGWIEARDVVTGDVVLQEGTLHDEGTLLGTAWGDSSLTNTSDKTVAYLACAQINKELIELKQSLFGGTITSKQRTTGYGSNMFYNLYVPPCPQLARLKAESIADNIHKLTDLGIALWFMDDGCKQKHKYSPAMKLALQSYSHKECNIIWSYFKARFGLGGCLDKAGNLHLSVPMSKRLCQELGYYFVPSMRYKMSHEGPDYSPSKCLQYASQTSAAIKIPVIGVKDEQKKKRGYSTSYCISVADNENFFTEYGVVANCRDTSGTLEASLGQRKDLEARGLSRFYSDYVQRLIRPAREMCAVGMPLDSTCRENTEKEIREKIKTLTKSFHEAVGGEINPNSSAQVQKYLREQGIKLPKKYDKATKAYKETSDSNAIKKIRLKHPERKELELLQDIKKLKKAHSSYIDFKTRPDGRLSYSLNVTGAETLRWSGGKDPWGNGFNIQTIPREGGEISIKSMFLAPVGYSFLECDLRQAESRFVAYDSADETLIHMLESGSDVHTHVGNAILRQMGKDPSSIPKEEFKKTWRQLGKKAGHGLNYGMKASVFMETVFNELDMVISKQDAETIREAYYNLFPGIPRWHKWIRDELYVRRKLTAPSGWERYFYGRPGDDMFKEAAAWRPQHTIPWITNHLMIYLEDWRGDRDFSFLTQVHDALYLLVRDEILDEVAGVCLDHKKWHPEVPLRGGLMYIPTEIKVGKRMSEMEEWNE